MSKPDPIAVFQSLTTAVDRLTEIIAKEAATRERLADAMLRLAHRLGDPDAIRMVSAVPLLAPMPPAAAPPPVATSPADHDPPAVQDLEAQRREYDRLRGLGLSAAGAATRLGIHRATPGRRGWPTGNEKADLAVDQGFYKSSGDTRDVEAVDRRNLVSLRDGDESLDAKIDADMATEKALRNTSRNNGATSARL